jgi:hypothetical protein
VIMTGIWKKIIRIAILCGLVAGVGSLLTRTVLKTLKGQTPSTLYYNLDNSITSNYGAAYTQAIKKSRQSAVRIVSGTPATQGHATSSGTYFTAQGKYYVVTVLHGLLGSCAATHISYQEDYYDCKEIIALDVVNDYAIMEVEQIPTRTPIKIPAHLPTLQGWKQSYSILNRIIYTGYPNTLGPLTLKGDVVGFSDTEFMYVFSYAWGGSSGSGVFDEAGNYVGYIIAIDVGQTEFGTDVLENVVLVVPAFRVDWSVVLNEQQ